MYLRRCSVRRAELPLALPCFALHLLCILLCVVSRCVAVSLHLVCTCFLFCSSLLIFAYLCSCLATAFVLLRFTLSAISMNTLYEVFLYCCTRINNEYGHGVRWMSTGRRNAFIVNTHMLNTVYPLHSTNCNGMI